MMAWFGVISCALLIGAVGASLPAARSKRMINASIFFAAAWIPLPGTDPFAYWLHALISTPSATLTQLALLACLHRRPVSLGKPVLLAFSILALEFYVLALGVGRLDVYGLGFHGLLLVAALFPLGLWLSHRGMTAWLLIFAVDLLAYGLGVYPNLWDALFDPLLVALAIFSLLTSRRKILGAA